MAHNEIGTESEGNKILSADLLKENMILSNRSVLLRIL